MRRTLVGLAAAAASALLLSGCEVIDTGVDSGNDAAKSGTKSAAVPAACKKDGAFLAVALPNLTNPYYIAMKKGFEEGAKAQGFTAKVQVANDDDAAQLAQVQSMLQQQPCALALNAVKSEPAAAIVAAANQAGVPVFTVNVKVDEDALKKQNAHIEQYLGADNVAGGKQMAGQVLKDLGSDGPMQIGFVTEPDEVPTQLRDQGFEDAIKADANAKVVAKVDGNVKPDDSLRATSEMLSGNPKINVIYASTGPGTFGALKALPANSQVKVYGFCAADQPPTQTYPGCVAQEPERYGQMVVQQVRSFVDGKAPKPEILLPLKLFVTGQTPAAGEVG